MIEEAEEDTEVEAEHHLEIEEREEAIEEEVHH